MFIFLYFARIFNFNDYKLKKIQIKKMSVLNIIYVV